MADDIRFAELIRKGLKRKNVKENPRRVGAVRTQDNTVHADILGIALIGAVGIREAIKISKSVRGDFDGLVDVMVEELQLKRSLLVMVGREYCGANGQMPAGRIAADLKNRRLSFRRACQLPQC